MPGRDLAIAVVLAVVVHCGVALVRVPTPQPPVLPTGGLLAISLVSHVSSPDVSETTVHEVREDNKEEAHGLERLVLPKNREETVQKRVKERAARKTEKDVTIPVETNKSTSPISDNAVTKKSQSVSPSQRGDRTEKIVTEPARPCYKSNPSPKYPEIARRRGYEGEVLLSVGVAADGTVTTLEVKQTSGHPVLDRAAIKAVAVWEFEPARRMGIPVPLTVDIPVRFVLRTP
jgi:protein TonB